MGKVTEHKHRKRGERSSRVLLEGGAALQVHDGRAALKSLGRLRPELQGLLVALSKDPPRQVKDGMTLLTAAIPHLGDHPEDLRTLQGVVVRFSAALPPDESEVSAVAADTPRHRLLQDAPELVGLNQLLESGSIDINTDTEALTLISAAMGKHPKHMSELQLMLQEAMSHRMKAAELARVAEDGRESDSDTGTGEESRGEGGLDFSESD